MSLKLQHVNSVKFTNIRETGSKYKEGRGIVEIADLVRKRIRQSVKNGDLLPGLKVSVKQWRSNILNILYITVVEIPSGFNIYVDKSFDDHIMTYEMLNILNKLHNLAQEYNTSIGNRKNFDVHIDIADKLLKSKEIKNCTDNNKEIIDILAAYVHDSWSNWIQYLLSKCERTSITNFNLQAKEPIFEDAIIPKEIVHQWFHKSKTAYTDLTENEKESNRKEAKRIIDIFNKK